MPLSESSERKRWNIYVKPDVISKAKVLAFTNGDTIGEYLEMIIMKRWNKKHPEGDSREEEKGQDNSS